MNRPNVVITGMARSGTSMAAAVFANRGYYIGERAAPADAANPLGYNEPRALVELNVALLREAGFAHHNTWMYEPVSDKVAEALAHRPPGSAHRAFVAACGRHAPWVWKDVRLCFTLPIWLPLLDPAMTRFILVRRRAEGVHHSIHRHRGKKAGDGSVKGIRRLADQHTRAASRALDKAGLPHFTLDYEAALRSPEDVADRLSTFTGLSLTADDLNAQPDLNHDTRRDRALTALRSPLHHPWVHPIARRLKSALSR